MRPRLRIPVPCLALWLSACTPTPGGGDDAPDATGSDSDESTSDSSSDGSTGSTTDPTTDPTLDPCLDSGCDDTYECVYDQDCPGEQVCIYYSCYPTPLLPTCEATPAFTQLSPPALADLSLTRVAAGDVDGDGLDEIVATAGNGEIHVFGLEDAQSVQTAITVPVEGAALLPFAIDGDGKLDLIIDRELWLGDGAGGFTHLGPLAADLEPIGELARIDLDGDGLDDLVRVDGDTKVWQNTGGAFIELYTPSPLDPVAVGDYFGTGEDSLGVRGSGIHIGIMRLIAGAWNESKVSSLFPLGTDLALPRMPGSDHDGLALIDAREGHTLVFWWHLDGLESMRTIPGGFAVVSLADLDGDGDEELLLPSDSSVFVDLEGCHGPLNLLGPAAVPIAADLDQDPAQELLLLSEGQLRVLDPL
ncbi:MAG: VCBS repeat-containing protein [Myxococcales bacterium]|nr:VCBS repeat-containing protein [Myxococcales bacterium]